MRCRIVGNGLYRPGNLFAGGAWTNCLVTGIAAQYLFYESRLVNCTVVSNNWGTDGQLFAMGASAVNCIFKGNYHSGGKAWDIAGYGHYYLTNCVYKAHPGWGDTYTIHDTDCVRETAKLFLDPAHPDFDARNPYALAPASPARNAGADAAPAAQASITRSVRTRMFTSTIISLPSQTFLSFGFTHQSLPGEDRRHDQVGGSRLRQETQRPGSDGGVPWPRVPRQRGPRIRMEEGGGPS